MPSVSIILPTFNRLRFLGPALASVYAQTWKDWELVIADDGSDEETRAYLRAAAPGARVLWLPHSGNPSLVRNAAIAAAQGQYLAFLDSDDLWPPHKLAQQIGAMRTLPCRRWSYTLCDHIDSAGRPHVRKRRPADEFPEGRVFEPLLAGEFSIAMPTVIAERELAIEAGGFDEQQRFGEFHDFCVRLALRSEVRVLREPLCSIRVHTEHYSGDRLAATLGWMRLHEKMAALAPTPALRSRCEQLRARATLELARLQGERGCYRDAWTTLRRASTSSGRYPQWWWGAFKTVVRAAVPREWRLALRRRA
jgi:glycosyltransferase involved in cell wall biosynthesis